MMAIQQVRIEAGAAPVVAGVPHGVTVHRHGGDAGFQPHAARGAHRELVVGGRVEIPGACIGPHEGSQVGRFCVETGGVAVIAAGRVARSAADRGASAAGRVAESAADRGLRAAGRVARSAADRGASAAGRVAESTAHGGIWPIARSSRGITGDVVVPTPHDAVGVGHPIDVVAPTAAADGRAGRASCYEVSAVSCDDVRAGGVRLQAQGTDAVDVQLQRPVVGGAQELGAGRGAGVTGKGPGVLRLLRLQGIRHGCDTPVRAEQGEAAAVAAEPDAQIALRTGEGRGRQRGHVGQRRVAQQDVEQAVAHTELHGVSRLAAAGRGAVVRPGGGGAGRIHHCELEVAGAGEGRAGHGHLALVADNGRCAGQRARRGRRAGQPRRPRSQRPSGRWPARLPG